MLTATCHCGAVRLTVPRKPRSVTDCNCSICRRYGVLWAYYKASSVRIEAKRGTTDSYSWGRKVLRFVRCANCGCVMCWQRVRPDPARHMGVNARNFTLEILSSLRIQPLDGAAWGDGTH
ncbi:MAG TPA: hypothetical protein VFE34_03725 [Dongiaceae bacterium]|jgi:hypothetical protein|nr:hypothetical protein [Dongiaceae bacterium]